APGVPLTDSRVSAWRRRASGPRWLSWASTDEPGSVHRLDDLFVDSVDGGYRHVFERLGRGKWDVRGGDPHDRPVEIPERLVGHDRGDLGAPAAQTGILLHREQATGLRHRVEDRLGVEGHEGPHVDHLGGDPLL